MRKRMLKKWMALMLSGTLVLGLIGCADNAEQPAETTPEVSDVQESQEEVQEASPETPVLYESEYGSKQEALQAGLDLNLAIAEEGMILFKNEGSALPIVIMLSMHQQEQRLHRQI